MRSRQPVADLESAFGEAIDLTQDAPVVVDVVSGADYPYPDVSALCGGDGQDGSSMGRVG